MNVIFIVLLVSSTIVQSSLAQNLQWRSITPDTGTVPPVRKHSGMVWTPAALYVFGGEGEDGALGDMWMFSLLTMEWSQLTINGAESPSSRYGFVGGIIGDYWYICHGTDGDSVFSDTWAFNFDSKEWLKVNATGEEDDNSGEVPWGRYFAAGGTVGDTGKLWVSMGIDRVDRKLSDTWTLDINETTPFQGTWAKVSDGAGLNQYDPTMPHARSNAAGAPLGNGVFIMSGGCASGGQVGGPCPLGDVWVLRETDGSWDRLSSCPPPSHSSSLGALNIQLPEIGVLYGGTQAGPRGVSQVMSGSTPQPDEVYFINTTTLKWSRIKLSNASVAPPLRSSPHTAAGASGMYMFGGEGDQGALLNDLWLLEGTGVNANTLPCSHEWFSILHLHGILMYVAWGLLLPLGGLMGRYYRCLWPVWLIIHVICQVLGMLLTVAGFVCVLVVGGTPSFPHGVIGIILMIIITQQTVSGIVRPWSKYDNKKDDDDDDTDGTGKEATDKAGCKHRWHKCWQVYHRVGGVIAIAVGFTQVTLGVFLVDAPVEVWGVWLGLLGAWLSVFLFHEIVYFTCTRSPKQSQK